MNEEIIKSAKIAFSTEYAFYLKAAFFHWNVEGSNFVQYHDLFGKIYEEVYGSIDTFAENIRKLGGYTPGSFTRFSALSEIDDEISVQPAESMIRELMRDSDITITVLKRVYDLAEQSSEHGFSNFLAERMDAHRKHSWMLRATLK
jgi:starvation-inducible DNA-binding protein